MKALLDLIEWAINQDVFTPALFLAICLKEAINQNNQKMLRIYVSTHLSLEMMHIKNS